MRIHHFIFMVVMASFVVFGQDANARTKNVKVSPGKTEVIGYAGIFDQRNCTYMRVKNYSVKTAPANGKVTVKSFARRIENGKCKGAKFYGYVFLYRGNGKKDRVQINVEGARYVDGSGTRVWAHKFNINN